MEEMQALETNGTWEVVRLPNGKKTVDSKWIFIVKYKSNGSIDRYNARLVVKGITQTQGLNYGKTFAPVARVSKSSGKPNTPN